MKFIREFILTREVFFNLLMLLMWANMLLAYMRGFIGFIPVIGNYQMESEAVVVACIVLLALPSVLNRMAPLDWIVLLGCLGVYLLEMSVFHNNYDVMVEKMFHTLCLTIPFFIMGRFIDIQKFLKPMIALSTICIILDALYFFIYMRNPEKMAERMAGEYYMYQAYRLLPHVMLLGWRGMKELSIWKSFLSVLGIFLILAYGTRGPLACLGVFYIICFFYFTHFKHSTIIKTCLVGLGGIAFLFQRPILILLNESLSALNMSTRIIERMLNGGLTHDTGRGFIKIRLYEYLDWPDTFWGYGLFGCTRFGMKYPHDYPLDFFFSFGYTAGTILLVFVSYIMVKSLVVARNSMEREFAVMLMCMTVLKYFFSSTFIQEGFYFALLGLCTSIIVRSREEERTPYHTSR